MLLDACALAGVQRWQPCTIETIEAEVACAPRSGPSRYRLHTSQGLVQAHNLVAGHWRPVHSQIGATDFGYRIAKQFGLPIVAQRPGLVPLRFAGKDWAPYADLAGVALPVRISTGEKKPAIAFDEDLLFTHRGLVWPSHLANLQLLATGPAADHRPGYRTWTLPRALQEAKASSKKQLPNLLAQWLPTRLAEAWCQHTPAWQGPVNECSDKALAQLGEHPQATGKSPPVAPKAMPRPKSPWAGWTRKRLRNKACRPSSSPACSLLARWWTSPAGWGL